MPRSVVEQITDALTHAATDTSTGTAADIELVVTGCPDLQGASVRGPRVEAYVYPCSGGGLAIDLWRHEARDPHAILRSPDLEQAARIAVAHAVAAPGRRHPPTSPATVRYAPTI